MRVVVSVPMEDLEKGQRSVKEFHGVLGKSYNLEHKYDLAHESTNPYLAPHGLFRRLANGNPRHAREFLQKFGPLKLSAGQRALLVCHVGVSLEEFWLLHSRFCLVAKLWENRDDQTRLGAALLEVYRRKDEASKLGLKPIGTGFAPPPSTEYQPYVFPWEMKGKQPEEWLHQASLVDLRNCAFYLISRELNLQMRSQIILWGPLGVAGKEGWRLVIWPESLYSKIWEFWGRDTAGSSWRRCPHCEMLFYPKRRDQFYCTPRQQALASKREYARKWRARQKRAKKVQNRKTIKNRKEAQR